MNSLWWFILGLILCVLEIIIPGFVLLWFGIGALVVAGLDFLGVHNLFLQVIIFAVLSIALTALSRTIFKNFFIRTSPGKRLKTNADALLDKEGVVTTTINNGLSQGRIYVEGQDWSARSESNELLEEGTKVKIVRYEGARLFVIKK
ncbi:MAG: NfeD family protein [FCB group bacterium]